jgi:hypothetical protein
MISLREVSSGIEKDSFDWPVFLFLNLVDEDYDCFVVDHRMPLKSSCSMIYVDVEYAVRK